MNRPAWQREGREPDYRFSLANERTFLAWIRTALAVVGGGVLFRQFAPGDRKPRDQFLHCCDHNASGWRHGHRRLSALEVSRDCNAPRTAIGDWVGYRCAQHDDFGYRDRAGRPALACVTLQCAIPAFSLSAHRYRGAEPLSPCWWLVSCSFGMHCTRIRRGSALLSWSLLEFRRSRQR